MRHIPKNVTWKLEHEDAAECVLVDTWCNCRWIVYRDGIEVAAVQRKEALATVLRMMGADAPNTVTVNGE